MRARASALRSPHLAASIQHYLDGFAEDLDSFYPGINALAMLKIQIELAKQLPTIWAEGFDDDDKADAALKECERRVARLASTLHLALGMDDEIERKDEKRDIWKEISRADLSFLTLDRPVQVGRAYPKLSRMPIRLRSTRRAAMSCCSASSGCCLPTSKPRSRRCSRRRRRRSPSRRRAWSCSPATCWTRRTGPADKARFPRTPEAEKAARADDRSGGSKRDEPGRRRVASASPAAPAGATFCFTKSASRSASRRSLFLALPQLQFQVEVGQSGRAGLGRALPDALPARAATRLGGLQGAAALARRQEGLRYLAAEQSLDDVQRLASDARRLTLIALYNPERDPDGLGGTAHLVQTASNWGFKTVELDARELRKV